MMQFPRMARKLPASRFSGPAQSLLAGTRPPLPSFAPVSLRVIQAPPPSLGRS
jgi:hypothetical protein